MTVKEITAITKSRYRVVLEDDHAFVLYKGELRRYDIKQGEELSEDAYTSIVTTVLPKRARLRCLNLLKTKDYTRKQLENKLKQGGYPQDIIEDALSYAESYNYINDDRYVRDFIEYNIQTKSRRRIENDLMNKGIGRDIINKIFDELESDGLEIDEESMIHELLHKKNYNVQTATNDEKRKMFSFLYRKGFHSDIIRRVLLLDIT